MAIARRSAVAGHGGAIHKRQPCGVKPGIVGKCANTTIKQRIERFTVADEQAKLFPGVPGTLTSVTVIVLRRLSGKEKL